jgi:hypothetical protein
MTKMPPIKLEGTKLKIKKIFVNKRNGQLTITLPKKKMKSVPSLIKLGGKGQVESWLGSLVQRPEGSPKLVRVKETAKEDFK